MTCPLLMQDSKQLHLPSEQGHPELGESRGTSNPTCRPQSHWASILLRHIKSRGRQRTQSRCTGDVVWKDKRVSFTVFKVLTHALSDSRKQASNISGPSLSVEWERNQMPLGPTSRLSSFSSAPGELRVGPGAGRLRLHTGTLWPPCVLQFSLYPPTQQRGAPGEPPKGMHSGSAGSFLPSRPTVHPHSSRRCWAASHTRTAEGPAG